ncbi:MAG: YihA family ribosome biogenesis GTP-binding protein [Gammaproteobacteria bacterium]|nr:YihA family ribosome biogenesis GTP-binding protein [Gammaproteobacteria bacterium]
MNPAYKQTCFVTSVFERRQLPAEAVAEAAFAGRSNAGKSSAINALCEQKRLAQISKMPGRTRALNFFAVDAERTLVDLPGYGYAKAPTALRRQWKTLIEHYLGQRRNLRGLMLVMDIRHPLTDHDWQLLDWCQARGLPLHILLTKADKISRGAAASTLQKVERSLRERKVDASVQTFSTLKRQGVEQAHEVLDAWLGF